MNLQDMLGNGRSRREFLRDANMAGGAVIGGGVLLAACGDDSSSESEKTSAELKAGGDLVVGLGGGGEFEAVDAHKGINTIDTARLVNLYDYLFWSDTNMEIVPALATGVENNASNTEALITLRDGVTFHNGKSFTSKDVVFSIDRILDPKTASGGAFILGPILKSYKADGPLGVKLTFTKPFNAEFVKALFSAVFLGIVPSGYDPAKPVGTGPWKFRSFTPGQNSVMDRNADYWQKPAYFETLTINSIPDANARLNALISGAVQVIDNVPIPLLSQIEGDSSFRTLISDCGNCVLPSMQADVEPFSDNRVRMALRLIANRPQIHEQVYAGKGEIANDMPGFGDPVYPSDIAQRAQDIEQVKSLLKEAGKENLEVDLVCAPTAAGAVETAVAFAEQAKEAGVTVNVRKLTVTNFFGANYGKRPFIVDNLPAVPFFQLLQTVMGPTAPYNTSHWTNEQFNKDYDELQAESDPAKQKEIVHGMFEQLYEDGTQIIPAFYPTIDAMTKNVAGFQKDKNGWGLTTFQFRLAGMTS